LGTCLWHRSCRPDASDEWTAQESPDWSTVVENVNGKYQDGNGDGIIDALDLAVLYKNYGRTSNKSTIANHITNGISYKLHRVGPIANRDGIQYELRLKNPSNTPVYVHGLACSINFGDNYIKEVLVDTTNSAIHPDYFLSLYDTITNTLDIALTRTCKPDLLTNNRVATLIIITDNVAMEDPIKIKRGNRIVSSNSFFSVGGGTFYDNNPPTAASTGSLQVTLSTQPVQCEQLGAAEVQIAGGQAPYQIDWSTGATSESISDLLAGTYTVTVTDAANNTKEYDPIESGLHKAATTITASGSIVANQAVLLQAGEAINLLPGFTTVAQSDFTAQIGNCQSSEIGSNYTSTPFFKGTKNSIATAAIPLSIELQIRPNPANQQTTIHYDLPTAGKSTLLLTDLQGRVVKKILSNRYQEAGHQSFSFSVKNFPKGMYLISLKTAEEVVTKKLIVLE